MLERLEPQVDGGRFAIKRVVGDGHGEPSPYRGGAPRSEPTGGLPDTALVSFLQNHDRSGSRAFGERITTLAPAQAIRAATALLFLATTVTDTESRTTPPLFATPEGATRAIASGALEAWAVLWYLLPATLPPA